MMSTDIGIDLGTASILVYIKGKGVVLKEPSVVAFDRDTNKIKAIGEEARLMLGRTPGNIVAVRPLRQGVISDYTVTEKMIKYFIQKALGKKTFRKPRISVCVPSGVTEVEKKAVEDATYQAGAREVSIIEEPIAAAIGAGIDIARPCGNMIVDIGGGTADIAVISLGGSVVSTSVKIAGDDFDEAIVRYMRKKHNLLIGERTAEDIKIKIGTTYPLVEEEKMEVRGRNLVTGLPKTVTVTSSETEEALRETESTTSEVEKESPEPKRAGRPDWYEDMKERTSRAHTYMRCFDATKKDVGSTYSIKKLDQIREASNQKLFEMSFLEEGTVKCHEKMMSDTEHEKRKVKGQEYYERTMSRISRAKQKHSDLLDAIETRKEEIKRDPKQAKKSSIIERFREMGKNHTMLQLIRRVRLLRPIRVTKKRRPPGMERQRRR